MEVNGTVCVFFFFFLKLWHTYVTSLYLQKYENIIRIFHECEGRKFRPKDRHLASRGLPNDDKR